jgi:speckle-type POZ protein
MMWWPWLKHLLVAADRYGLLDRLKLLSEDKLCSSIDKGNVGTVLALAEQHGCNGHKKACYKFLMSDSNLKACYKLLAEVAHEHIRRL